MNIKTYFDNGNTLNFGENIPQEKFYALKQGEIFTLLGKDKKSFSKVLMDSYGIIREKSLTSECTGNCSAPLHNSSDS